MRFFYDVEEMMVFFFHRGAGDILGKCLAWCSLLPIFVVVGFVTLILFRRELHTVSGYLYTHNL